MLCTDFYREYEVYLSYEEQRHIIFLTKGDERNIEILIGKIVKNGLVARR